jgi:hypothetical protein
MNLDLVSLHISSSSNLDRPAHHPQDRPVTNPNPVSSLRLLKKQYAFTLPTRNNLTPRQSL